MCGCGNNNCNSCNPVLLTRGPQGPIGPQGIVGPVGPQGLTGNTGATGPAGIGYLTAVLSLNAAQIKTLNSVPVQIVVAPGIGLAIEVESASVVFTFGTAPFSNSSVNLLTNTAAANQFSQSGVLNLGVSTFCSLARVSTTSIQLVGNKQLYVTSNADSGGGDGGAKIYISYRIITL